jgi:hypothetical protein
MRYMIEDGKRHRTHERFKITSKFNDRCRRAARICERQVFRRAGPFRQAAALGVSRWQSRQNPEGVMDATCPGSQA